MTSYWCKKLHWSPFLHRPGASAYTPPSSPPGCAGMGRASLGTHSTQLGGPPQPTAWTQSAPGKNSPGEAWGSDPSCTPTAPSHPLTPLPPWRLERGGGVQAEVAWRVTRRTPRSPDRWLFTPPLLCPALLSGWPALTPLKPQDAPGIRTAPRFGVPHPTPRQGAEPCFQLPPSLQHGPWHIVLPKGLFKPGLKNSPRGCIS